MFVRILLEIFIKSGYVGKRLAYTQYLMQMWVFFLLLLTDIGHKKDVLAVVSSLAIIGLGTLWLNLKYFIRIQLEISSKPRYTGTRLKYTHYNMTMWVIFLLTNIGHVKGVLAVGLS